MTTETNLQQAEARKGVWKSGKGRGRHTPKGRQLDDGALEEIQALLGDRPRREDLLIEFLHLIQDQYGHLSAMHLRALANEMKMPCLLYTSPSPRDGLLSRMPSSA